MVACNSSASSGGLVCYIGVLCLLLLAATAEAKTTSAAVEVPQPLSAKPVLQWTPHDVEIWMNTTIGYPEYSGYVRKHLIDGVTLVELDAEDFENFLPITDPLHVIKLKAHVKLLRGQCSCHDGSEAGAGGSAPQTFGAYMAVHSARTWIEGTTALFFPRTSMLMSVVFDRELYYNLISRPATANEVLSGATRNASEKKSDTERRTSIVRCVFFWLCFLVAPDLYLAFQALMLIPSSYVLMPFFVLHFIFQAYNEYILWYMIYEGTAFEGNVGYLQRIWAVFSYTLFLPLLGVAVAYVFPVFLQYVCVAALVVHSLLMMIGLLFLLFRGEELEAVAKEAAKEAEKGASTPKEGGTATTDHKPDAPVPETPTKEDELD